MKRAILLTATLLTATLLNGQNLNTDYTEPTNPTPTDRAAWSNMNEAEVKWGSCDVRYKKELPAVEATTSKQLELTAWRGEKISAQLTLSTPRQIDAMAVRVSELRSKRGATITTESINTAFVRYVITDELNKDGKGACGYRRAIDFDSTLVADPLDHLINTIEVSPNSTQPCWITIKVPEQSAAGRYYGTVSVMDGAKTLKTLKIAVDVKDRVLPQPDRWTFHLDLWQNPYAVARYHNVEPFSKEHFDLMRPLMKLYADAGGKVITASIMHKPWNGQTFDYFESMVTWIKKADGSWWFDYTVFDKWVEFMIETGVTGQISCFSMVPWKMSFQYIDQATNSFKYVNSKAGEEEYDQMWTAMLTSFSKHLRRKGWFEMTHIAMDERPMEAMLATMEVIRKADKEFKVSLAGSYHKELSESLDDYCISIGDHFPASVIAARKQAALTTTYYTCCTEPRPNTFTFSPPAEAEWLGWYAAREKLDGYLRWALNSWVENPLQDSRFVSWAAGDTYLIYPFARSSIRFERLTEGIEAFEKIAILRTEFGAKGDYESLEKIDRILSQFDPATLADRPADEVVNQAKQQLNQF